MVNDLTTDMPARIPKPIEPITESLRSRNNAELHGKMGVRPFIFKVRQPGQEHLVRVRALGDTVEAARLKVRKLMPKAVEIHAVDE